MNSRDPGLDLHHEREIDLDCTRALYRQIPNSFAAAMVVTAYMMATLWRLAPHPWLWEWLGVQALAQVHRGAVLLAFRRAEAAGRVDTASAALWARRYAGYMGVAGGVWALAALLFAQPSQPLALAFTLCGLYGITGGAVPGNAYHRPAVMNFIWPVFGVLMARMAWTGRLEFISLGLASMAFAGILTMFCRVQHAGIRDSLRVRFENRALLAQLAVEKAEAEDARSRAEQASLAKSRFLAAASHDLRQPLHALSLFSASLHGLQLDAAALGAARNIQANIDALEDLFDALLDVSRLDAGVIEARLAPVALQPLLEGIAAGLQPVAQGKGLTLRVLPSAAWVRADPVLLRQVLTNLTANALRYTEQGQVVLAVRRSPASWRIECRDSGVGIAAQDQGRIFEEFVQLHNPHRDRREGLGLGLAIAQRCARLLGSDIAVRSRPGAGSVFALQLPAVAADGPQEARFTDKAGQAAHAGRADQAVLAADLAVSDDDPLAGCRILVIDDERSIREGLQLLLSQWGCDVVVAADRDQALAAFDDGIELVLADLRLPGEWDGLATLDQLRALRAERAPRSRPLPACLITGESDPIALRQARDSRVPLLHKPVRAGQLRATLLHVLSAP